MMIVNSFIKMVGGLDSIFIIAQFVTFRNLIFRISIISKLHGCIINKYPRTKFQFTESMLGLPVPIFGMMSRSRLRLIVRA